MTNTNNKYEIKNMYCQKYVMSNHKKNCNANRWRPSLIYLSLCTAKPDIGLIPERSVGMSM